VEKQSLSTRKGGKKKWAVLVVFTAVSILAVTFWLYLPQYLKLQEIVNRMSHTPNGMP
jgi:hypothetical protein